MRFIKKLSLDEKGLVVIIESGEHLVELNFGAPFVWQCVDESATLHDKEEIVVSKGDYEVLSKSIYLDYAVKEFGWYAQLNNQNIEHYRLLTRNEIVDVISSEIPVVTELEA